MTKKLEENVNILLRPFQFTFVYCIPGNQTNLPSWECRARGEVVPELAWMPSTVEMKNSWASCCSYPARLAACRHQLDQISATISILVFQMEAKINIFG